MGWFYTDGINDKDSAANLKSQTSSDIKSKVDAGKSWLCAVVMYA